MTDTHGLSPALVERVLEGLGLEAPPDISREGVEDLYAAWCRRVPFDNVRKLIHLRNGGAGSLPGDDPASFFEPWLEHGTGATCWAGSGAMWALLAALGFRAQRVLATITFAPDLPPNHGSTIVDIGGDRLDVIGASAEQVGERHESVGTHCPIWRNRSERSGRATRRPRRPEGSPSGCAS